MCFTNTGHSWSSITSDPWQVLWPWLRKLSRVLSSEYRDAQPLSPTPKPPKLVASQGTAARTPRSRPLTVTRITPARSPPWGEIESAPHWPHSPGPRTWTEARLLQPWPRTLDTGVPVTPGRILLLASLTCRESRDTVGAAIFSRAAVGQTRLGSGRGASTHALAGVAARRSGKWREGHQNACAVSSCSLGVVVRRSRPDPGHQGWIWKWNP
jgi:hypothetical protein